MAINSVCLSGNLTRDAQLNTTASDVSVLNVGMAVNERRQNKNTGKWEDVPCFVDLVMFGKRAASIAQYLTKGTHVSVQGKLCYSSWERDGQRRSKLEVIINEIDFTPKKQADVYQDDCPF